MLVVELSVVTTVLGVHVSEGSRHLEVPVFREPPCIAAFQACRIKLSLPSLVMRLDIVIARSSEATGEKSSEHIALGPVSEPVAGAQLPVEVFPGPGVVVPFPPWEGVICEYAPSLAEREFHGDVRGCKHVVQKIRLHGDDWLALLHRLRHAHFSPCQFSRCALLDAGIDRR